VNHGHSHVIAFTDDGARFSVNKTMHAKERHELLEMLRQVVSRLEQGFAIQPSTAPVCEACGSNLRCVHCMGSEGGRKLSQTTDKETRRNWGKKGGRPRRQKAVPDSLKGTALPSTMKPSATIIPSAPSPEFGIDPAKFYRPEEAAPLLGVTLNTMRHWRTKKRGPAYLKLDGHFVRYSGKDLLEWLSRSRASA